MDPIVFGDRRVSRAIWAKLVQDEGGCWRYMGKHTPTGWPTHNHRSLWRILFTALVGPIAFDHDEVTMTCESGPKFCVNPYHRLIPDAQITTAHMCPVCQCVHNPALDSA